MIKYLDGIKETVDFKEFQGILLYQNVDYEDYPNHWHSSMEIVMPTDGIYHISIGDTEYNLKPGDILFISPGVLHHLHACEGKRLILLVDFSSLNSISTAISPIMSLIHPALLVSNDTDSYTHKRCYDILNAVSEHYNSNELFREVDMYALLLQLITTVGRSYAGRASKPGDTYQDKSQAYLDKFMRICEYIDIHYSEDLSLEKVAELAGFSKYHFERLFKGFTGITFYKYLNKVRITQSQALINNPSLTMTEVALKSGFNSSSTFIRMFKQINGCTPTEFRNTYRPEIDEDNKED